MKAIEHGPLTNTVGSKQYMKQDKAERDSGYALIWLNEIGGMTAERVQPRQQHDLDFCVSLPDKQLVDHAYCGGCKCGSDDCHGHDVGLVDGSCRAVSKKERHNPRGSGLLTLSS